MLTLVARHIIIMLISHLLLLNLVSAQLSSESNDKKEWTFLIFLNADNNLDQFGVGDVEEMMQVGSTDQFNMVVQFDRSEGEPCNRLFINKGSYDIVEAMGECDMGSADVLTDFVEWGAQHYPAKKYAVVIWNHGSGWSKKRGNTIFKGISYDDQSGNHITTAQLTPAVAKMQQSLGQKVDILAFDACLMQMLEVSYAVKDHVDIMLASEDIEPGEGWAYYESMAPIAANPEMGPAEVATMIVDTYDESYDGGSQGNRATTQSWVRMSKIDNLINALNEASATLNGNFIQETKKAISKVQKFYYRSNIDLIHFLKILEQQIAANTDTSLSALKSQLLDQLSSAKNAANDFVGHSKAHGYNKKNSYGTAIYFPSRGYSFSQKYTNLDFAKASQWDEMLQAFYQASKTRPEDLGL
ncbi:MAG: clostripain-related cysteine peptidase [bacterium]|nr:clostripain-related cysteine peptidase [bacterium]